MKPALTSLVFLLGTAGLAIRTATAQGYVPEEAAGRMTVAEGLEVRLFAAEPMVRQPVAIEFDDRGRLWVIQYLQYPNPAELKRVKVDRYSRTAYDRVPDPPPRGPKGADRITILEDANGDGRADRSHDFMPGSTWRAAWRSATVGSSSSRCRISSSIPTAITTTGPTAIPKCSCPASAWKTPTRWRTR